MDICEKFGLNLKKIRKQQGLTQEQLAELCDLDRTYISSLERGKRSISLKNIEKLSIALNLHISELFLF